MAQSVTDTRRGVVVALSGVLYVVLVFTGGAAIAGTRGPGRHSLDATVDEIATYVAEVNTGRVWVGEYIGLVGFALFLPFAAYVWSVTVDGADERDWLGRMAMAAAATYVALTAAGIATLAPALNREPDPSVVGQFLDLRAALLGLAFVFLAVWLVAVGAQILRSRALSAWVGWAAIAIGVLQIVLTPLAAYDPGFTGIPTFASFLWVLVVSTMLLRRQRSGAVLSI